MEKSKGGFFRFPITEEIAKSVGSFSILWGELDFFLLILLNELQGLEWHQIEKKYGGEQTRARMNYLLAVLIDYKEVFSEDVKIPVDLPPGNALTLM